MTTVTLGTGFTRSWGSSLRLAVPLTTIWTPPAGCDRIVTFQSRGANDGCAPPQYEQIWYNNGYYSPGICPSGYTVGCTAQGQTVNFETINAEETAALCVPSLISITRVPAFQIRWQSSDLSIFETPPIAGSEVTTVTIAPVAITVTAPPRTSTVTIRQTILVSTDEPPLSTGGIVGIAVGVGVIAILGSIAATFLLIRKMGRRNTKTATQTQALPESYGGIRTHDKDGDT
ncbi:hypothetical protein H072_7242 [Dactylellina haptotyla CBS 200.50]|uniref:Uncharacterized protein n=1 Tax=Dactylellina haptotyla (strain CBS 200.50) TaxID=1284197 RepID=S8A7K9_DACHA|nr:hypothetical protein H072_7242 [Dactylellina haptotyla CBS 200.50]